VHGIHPLVHRSSAANRDYRDVHAPTPAFSPYRYRLAGGAAVNRLPFGFTPGGGAGDEGGSGPGGGGPGGGDPFGGLFGGVGGGDLSGALRRLADLLSWQGGPVNWDLARSTAVEAITREDRLVTVAEVAQVEEAVRLADLWLDPVTTLPSGVSGAEAWSRQRWVEATTPVWAQLCDPVATRVVAAMGGALPDEMRAMAGPLLGMLGQIGGLVFGAQVGSAIGNLATEVVGSTDIGLPLGPSGRAALLPVNVAGFGAGLGLPPEEVRLYLALREAAYHRLFTHVPWLRSHLFEAVAAYARGISVDSDAISRALGSIDPTAMDPEALQRALGEGLFQPQESPAQRAALARLETALALTEGWVDEVATAAATGHLPAAVALRETVRRRRAEGGPAEQAFATFVGLELRPRRLRDAANLWAALAATRGTDGRDAVWSHPDLLPSAADLDDPLGFAAGTEHTDAATDFDAELRRLAAGDSGPAAGDGSSAKPGSGSSEGPDDQAGGTAAADPDPAG